MSKAEKIGFLVLGLVVGLVIGAVVGGFLMSGYLAVVTRPYTELPPTIAGTTSTVEGVLKMSAEELRADYDKNELAADMKYRGRIIEVTGTISSIGRDPFSDKPQIKLRPSVCCTFPSSQEAVIAELTSEQTVTVRGRVTTEGVWIDLVDCSLVG